jgi:hypothetical protein
MQKSRPSKLRTENGNMIIGRNRFAVISAVARMQRSGMRG